MHSQTYLVIRPTIIVGNRDHICLKIESASIWLHLQAEKHDVGLTTS